MVHVIIDIEITPAGTKGNYNISANIIRGPANIPRQERTASEKISINLQEWEDLDGVLQSLKARARGIKEETQVKNFGNSLFQQVIKGSIYTLYKRGKDHCNNKYHTLRLRFYLGSPELIELPWEFLREDGIFLALNKENPRTLIMRCPIDVKPARTVEHHLPLQIMIMAAEPEGYEAGANDEKELIKKALQEVEAKGLVSLKEIKGTDTELETIHINVSLDIFHFIGHGDFNKEAQEGELILEGPGRAVRKIPAFKFSMSLPNKVRLVFLNACELARGNAQDLFSSVPYLLANQGNVVIAMQFRISIGAAVLFARVFYEEIASGLPIDEAVATARHRVYTKPGTNPLDWAAPVLYMKSTTGILFDIKTPDSSEDEEIVVDITDNPGEDIQSPVPPPSSTISNSIDLSLHYKRADSLYKRKKFREALKEYEKLCHLDSSNAALYNGIADVHYELKEYGEALIACEHAIRLDQKNAYAYYNKGLLLEALAHPEEAQRAYEKARELGLD